MKIKYSLLLLALVSAALMVGGCEDYSAYPGYGPYYGGGPNYAGGPYYGRPYYGGGPNYAGGPYYGRPYGGYAGAVAVEVGDRAYYVHGPGYYQGRTYYVWKPGHWASRNGQRVWIHGHYVVRGY